MTLICTVYAMLFHEHFCFIIFQFEFTDPPKIEAGLLVGWTYEREEDPISFSVEAGYPLYFRTIQRDIYPLVNQIYTFEDLSYPNVHSIKVGIYIGMFVLHSYALYLICLNRVLFVVYENPSNIT
jgi:hypothetical protein